MLRNMLFFIGRLRLGMVVIYGMMVFSVGC